MAITTLDGVIAGFQAPVPLVKNGGGMAANGTLRGYSPWYVGGSPGASTATAVGVNGEACVPALGASVAGRISRTNPATLNAYLGRLAMNASAGGSLWLIDRLWQNSGLLTTSITAQAITPAALTARSGDGTINGQNVLAAVEWSVIAGAGTPTVNLTYTNQAGVAGQTATMIGASAAPSGTVELFMLAAGDTGVRSVQSFIQSATRTSGTMHLMLFRMIASVDITTANIGSSVDALTSGMPRIYNDSCLQLLWFPIGVGGVNFVGSYVETQG